MPLYTIFIEPNSRYMEEGARYEQGSYATAEEALQICKKIVDDFLVSNHKSSQSADDLYKLYSLFGDSPLIVCPGGEAPDFSGFEYAKTRAQELCI